MQHNTNTAGIDFSYIAVLLLLAYLLTSAPRYVRQLRETDNNNRIEKVSPLKEVLKLGKYYSVDPYLRVWNQLAPGSDKTKPRPENINLASIEATGSR